MDRRVESAYSVDRSRDCRCAA